MMIKLQKMHFLMLLTFCLSVNKMGQSITDNKTALPVLTNNIINWEISKELDNNVFNKEKYPRFYEIFFAGWKKIEAEPDGVINISKYFSPAQEPNETIYARTYIGSETDKKIKAVFGYKGAIKVFLNQEIIYLDSLRNENGSLSGEPAAQDTVCLNLRKGRNEIFIILSKGNKGWGFIIKSSSGLERIRKSKSKLTKIWETDKFDLQPESVIYDPENKVIYASIFDNLFNKIKEPRGYVAKLNKDGTIIKRRWIDSLYAPSGICVYKNKMYILERKNLVEADIKTGKILNRYLYPKSIVFANDIAVNKNGNIFITNSFSDPLNDDIFIFKNNKFEMWYTSNELASVNGIDLNGNEIIIGNSGKGLLQAIDLKTKKIKTICSIGSSIVDGIESTSKGDYIVSDWLGNLFQITQSGVITRLLEADGISNTANFALIEKDNLLIIPSFLTGTIKAYEIE